MSSNLYGAGKGSIAPVKRDPNHSIGHTERTVSHRGQDLVGKDAPFEAVEPKRCRLAQSGFEMTADESQRFLRIISNASHIKHHYELFLLLQGEVQHFISHQILIAAWGDFHNSNPTIDVVSALPGVRTGEINDCGSDVGRMVKDLRARWIANGRRKMLLNNGNVKSITSSICNCALHKSMREMQSIFVHGVRNERDQIDSIYVALDPDSVIGGRSIERFFPLVEPLIAQIDVAFQKVGALNPAGATARVDGSSSPGKLSEREREIIKWVTEGRTNAEIGAILDISSFTVKNHVQRIFRKLGATNRTEAVSKWNQCGFQQETRTARVTL